jgi:hypothetical protein
MRERRRRSAGSGASSSLELAAREGAEGPEAGVVDQDVDAIPLDSRKDWTCAGARAVERSIARQCDPDRVERPQDQPRELLAVPGDEDEVVARAAKIFANSSPMPPEAPGDRARLGHAFSIAAVRDHGPALPR